MEARNINYKTNSFYSEEEKQILNDLGFFWSNASNKSLEGHENCMYLYKNAISYDIEARKEGFDLKINMPELFDNKTISFYKISFNELLKILTFKSSFQNILLKINARILLAIHILLIILISPILLPIFVKLYDGRDFKKLSLFQKAIYYFTNNFKKFNPFQALQYYMLNDIRMHIFIFYIIILTVLITLFISS